jgi:branched-chain amino acid transport system permease protein
MGVARWRAGLAVLLALVPLGGGQPYAPVLLIDMLVAALFAASLHFIMGPAGMHSFGHAAYFGLGAYGGGLLLQSASACHGGRTAAGAAGGGVWRARVSAGSAVRLSGVYLAMLTLAFAQITWAMVFQWDAVTGGSNGITGVWPRRGWPDKRPTTTGSRWPWWRLGVLLLRRCCSRPLATRCARARFAAARRCHRHRRAQGCSGRLCGGGRFWRAGGALYAFSKGSISPEAVVGKSVDGLVMVLLGGVQTLAGPVVGAVTFTWLHDTVARNTDYWRAVLGGTILAAGAAVSAGAGRVCTASGPALAGPQGAP